MSQPRRKLVVATIFGGILVGFDEDSRRTMTCIYKQRLGLTPDFLERRFCRLPVGLSTTASMLATRRKPWQGEKDRSTQIGRAI